MQSTVVKFSNGAKIGLLRERGNLFAGLGGVSVNGVPLRDGSRPFRVRLDTPEGVLYPTLQIERTRKQGNGVKVEMIAVGLPWGRTENLDNYTQSMVTLEPPGRSVRDRLTLHLAPVRLALGGREWTGFSYAFEFRSAQRKIHRLWTDGTWEIGGRVTGNTVLHQGHCNMPVYKGARTRLFTTHCLNTLDQYGSPLGSSFQLAPRGGLLQTFDFQFARAGALLQFWPTMESIASLVESPPGSDRLHVVDEYRFALTNHARTTPKWVLFSPGALAEHEARNLWWAAHEHVNGCIRARFKVRPTVAAPEASLRYRTRVVRGALRMHVAGVEVDSAEVPYAIAERVLPRLAKQGVRRFISEVMSESDVTELGMKRKLDRGIHGDLHCASVCATHRFLPSEFWGGMKAWRFMHQSARRLGMELGAWFAPHFSPRAPIYQEHPEWRMLDANGLPSGGGYGFQTLNTADWNTGIYNWALADLRRWKQEGGLDYLFTDSWPNLGTLQVNFGARMRTNFRALGRLYHDIQRLGIATLSFEGISPFGTTRIGIADLQGARMEQDRSVAGQNDFGWWDGHEDMLIGMCPMVHARGRGALELERISFRAMANRACITWDNQYGLPHRLPGWWSRLNHIYGQAMPHMKRRELLPGCAGVRWHDGNCEVLWLYRDLALPSVAARRVERLDGHRAVILPSRESSRLRAWNVYRISS